jgi:hypothetical protein
LRELGQENVVKSEEQKKGLMIFRRNDLWRSTQGLAMREKSVGFQYQAANASSLGGSLNFVHWASARKGVCAKPRCA